MSPDTPNRPWKCVQCGATTMESLAGPTGGGAGPRCIECGGSMKKVKKQDLVSPDTPETPQVRKRGYLEDGELDEIRAKVEAYVAKQLAVIAQFGPEAMLTDADRSTLIAECMAPLIDLALWKTTLPPALQGLPPERKDTTP